jgi:hypothetical protein
MCCFSPVSAASSVLSRLFFPPKPPRVFGTRIFARMDRGRQALVYSMTISVRGDVAMILPLPVPPDGGEDAVEFVDLEGYADFFEDMAGLFLVEPPAAKGGVMRGGPSLSLPRLVVHAVGSFEASFVPTMRDFSRLDPRFRIADDVWRNLPVYADWGFAVFKLAPGRKKKIHPMALRFPTRAPGRLFFPTVHVHDGAVEAKASFDHRLFHQGGQADFAFQDRIGGMPSPLLARHRMRLDKSRGLVLADQGVTAIDVVGEHRNEDTWVPLGSPAPAA